MSTDAGVPPQPRTPRPTIESLTVADDPQPWREAGFEVDGDRCRVGSIAIRLAGRDAGRGLVGWTLRGVDGADLDGLRTEVSDSRTAAGQPAPIHPNSVKTVDHVVAFTPDRARTVAALEAAGLDCRRLRDEPTPAGGGFQAFFRLGEAILEVIEFPEGSRGAADRDAPARLWGLAFGVESLDRTAEVLGDRLGEPRDAVQPGRRIATLRREAGLSPAIAFMTPGPGAA
ncbi:MAG TPA: hypothetical protein VF520_09975 [Thermoleophilaceae bacterium]